jgi:hypothetical protein
MNDEEEAELRKYQQKSIRFALFLCCKSPKNVLCGGEGEEEEKKKRGSVSVPSAESEELQIFNSEHFLLGIVCEIS